MFDKAMTLIAVSNFLGFMLAIYLTRKEAMFDKTMVLLAVFNFLGFTGLAIWYRDDTILFETHLLTAILWGVVSVLKLRIIQRIVEKIQLARLVRRRRKEYAMFKKNAKGLSLREFVRRARRIVE